MEVLSNPCRPDDVYRQSKPFAVSGHEMALSGRCSPTLMAGSADFMLTSKLTCDETRPSSSCPMPCLALHLLFLQHVSVCLPLSTSPVCVCVGGCARARAPLLLYGRQPTKPACTQNTEVRAYKETRVR